MGESQMNQAANQDCPSQRPSLGGLQWHTMKEQLGRSAVAVPWLGLQGAFPSGGLVSIHPLHPSGLWLKPFPLARVIVSDFHVDENTIVKVPMMVQDQREHWYLQDRRVPCSVLRMDYQGDALAYFILPQEGKMKEVEQKLTLGILERWNCLFRNR